MTLLQAIAPIIGGLVFFVFGLQTVNRAVEKLSGAYLKVALNLLTGNRVAGAVVGMVSSFALASTSAATVLFVGMGNTGLLTLRQAIPVILGAAVGTSLTVQVIAFDLGRWSIFIITAGFILRLTGKYDYRRDVGRAIFGVGLVFFGVAMMKGGAQAAVTSATLEALMKFFERLAVNPFYLFLLGIGVTAVLQSSAITMALAFAFGVSVEAAIPIAIGASVGTTTAGLVSGAASKPIGKQIAVAHFVMKLLAASFFMLMLAPFTQTIKIWALRLDVSPIHTIANANTLYNVLSAVIFLPLVPVVEQFVLSIAGQAKLAAPFGGLSLSDLDDPPAAVSKAKGQTVKMGRIALSMLRRELSAFLVDSRKVVDEILDSREVVLTIDTVLGDFVRRIDETRLSGEDNRTRDRLLYCERDIGYVSDVIGRELAPLARKKTRRGVDFSIEGAQQFERFHRLVADDFSEALDLLEGLPANAEAVLAHAGTVDAMRRELALAHIQRVSQGVTADVETSRILLDAVAALRVIHYYVCDMIRLLANEETPLPSHLERP